MYFFKQGDRFAFYSNMLILSQTEGIDYHKLVYAFTRKKRNYLKGPDWEIWSGEPVRSERKA